MKLSRSILSVVFYCLANMLSAAAELPLDASTRLPAGAPDWRDLAEAFGRKPDAIAAFAERRYFPFKKEPVALTGEVRASKEFGLSLHYLTPEERTVILDRQGLVVREGTAQKAPAADPRASAVNEALLHILRLDFVALEKSFELHGRRDGPYWTLGLVPRATEVRRAIGEIFVSGMGDTVRTIELRRSAKQRIEIQMEEPRSPVTFTAEERKRFFR